MTINEFFVELETCKNDFSWNVDEITGEIRGNDIDGNYCCPLTALARQYGYEYEIDEYRDAARKCGIRVRTDEDPEALWRDDDAELIATAADLKKWRLDDDSPTPAIRARLLQCFSLEEVSFES